MTAEEILAVFCLKKITQTEIAKKFGVSRVMIHMVIHGRSKSRRIQEEIAQIVGREVDEIWPPRVA